MDVEFMRGLGVFDTLFGLFDLLVAELKSIFRFQDVLNEDMLCLQVHMNELIDGILVLIVLRHLVH